MEAIDRGAGRNALHSLFEGALRGWRRQPFYDNQYVADGNVLHHLRRSRPIAYNVSRKRRLEKRWRSAGAAVRPFDELDAMLVALPAIRYRYGTTHGDLHGNNVRIAGADAILIDFASVDYGPLTVDPAALDVSLMMDTRLIAGDDWVRLADEVYELKALRAPACRRAPNGMRRTSSTRCITSGRRRSPSSSRTWNIRSSLRCSCSGRHRTTAMMPRANDAGCTPSAWRTGSSVN
jgi:hypothetical protein